MQTKKAQDNSANIRLGSTISFSRRDLVGIIGEVITIRDASVIVKVPEYVKNELQIDNNLTVVAHRNYVIKDL